MQDFPSQINKHNNTSDNKAYYSIQRKFKNKFSAKVIDRK